MPPRIHLIANSHIDPVWLWDRYEGIDEVLNTFRSACDRLDEVGQLHFTTSSLQFYAWVRDHDPALFERVRAHVAAGRWEITGGWWIEPDTNLPTADSFRRHRELSDAFLAAHFPGVAVDVAYVPDSFGHPASLPKVLAETGFEYFLFCRPTAHEKPDLPGNLFWWCYRGHRVLAYRVKHHYLQPQPDGADKDDELRRRLADPEYAAQGANAFLFGLGDHGGGPTKREIAFYQQHIADHPKAGLAFSTCGAFFRDAASLPDIPSYEGDLHFHAVGCYSVVRDLKQGMRGAERGLAFAARAARLAGGPPPDLDGLWHTTLFNQFHDILPGSCSPAAADMARAELGGVDAGWRDAAYAALKKLTAAHPVSAPEGEFRVVNTLDRQLTVPLAVESFQYFRDGAAFCDDTGRELTVQEVAPSVRCKSRRWAFVDTLGAGAVRSYRFTEAAAAGSQWGDWHFTPGDRIEAGGWHLDPGGLHDAGGDLRLPMPRLLVLDDDSDTWGHGVRRYDDVIGAFELASAATATGPVVSRLYQRWTFGRSAVDVVWSLWPAAGAVRVDITAEWAEDRRILKWELAPTGCAGPRWLMAGPGGAIERARNGDEQPLHAWIRVAGDRGDDAFALVQEGAFAADADPQALRVNLVRSNLYGFHDPLQPADPQHPTDRGLHSFRFELRFGADAGGPDQPAALDDAAAAFLEPFWVLREGPR